MSGTDYRDTLLQRLRAASIVEPEPVDVPVLGRIYLAPQTDYQATRARRLLEQYKDSADDLQTGRALALMLVDESGEQMFDVDDQEQVAMLAKLKSSVTAKIWAAQARINGGDVDPKA